MYVKQKTLCAIFKSLFLLLALTIFGQLATTAAAQVAGRWRFDAASGPNAADSGPNALTGILLNGPSWTLSGINSAALLFDGYNDYVSVPHHLGLNSSATFSLTLWIKKDADNDSAGLVLGKASGLVKEYALWAEPGEEGGLAFEQTDASGASITSLLSSSALDSDRWYHVSVTIDQEKVRLYLDGELDGATERSSLLSAGSLANLTVGADATGGNAFGGALDEIGIYDEGLTRDRILDESGRVVYWKFNESAGLTAANAVTDGVPGILINGPTWVPSEGYTNGSLHFDGVDDYVALAGENSPNLTRQVGFSLWFKKDADPLNDQYLISKGDDEFVLYEEGGASGHIIFQQLTSTGTVAVNAISNSSIPIGVWTHVAISLENNVAELYINGTLDANARLTDVPVSTNKSIHIGADQLGNHAFCGSMDNVQIYRRPLGIDQVANLSGRVGHWRLDDSAGMSVADASYLADDGALVGNPIHNQDGGVVGGCITLDGSGQRVLIPDAPHLQLPEDFTLSLWARKTGESNSIQVLASKGATPSNFALYEEAGSGGRIIFEQANAAGNVVQIVSTAEMPLNAWTHLAVTMKNGLATLYMNGVENGSAQRTAGGVVSPSPISIGAEADGGEAFSGQLDEVEVYNRALAPTDVAQETTAASTDSDGDGLTDSWEIQYFGDLRESGAGDFDADGLTNLIEFQKGIRPDQLDTDNDAMPDKWEVDNNLNAAVSDGNLDTDGDGLNNFREYQMNNNVRVADADAVAGSSAGGFSVGLSGDASYSMPVIVTPGTAGMTPKVSLNYSSQGGTGLLGVGWSLGGYTTISRIPRSKLYDNVAGTINYDNNDRLAIDGQRLIAYSGSYWGTNSKYRTEIDNFQKVRLVSTDKFEVMTKSGIIITYGGTADSVIRNADNVVLEWSVSRMADTKGNYMDFTYNTDFASSRQHYPLRINYTLGNGNSAYASVRYEYEERSDVSKGYTAGIARTQSKRLRRINNFYNESLVRRYEIGYDTSAISKRSRIATITEKAGTDGKLFYEPTKFTYDDREGVLVGTNFSNGTYGYSEADTRWLEGDFDGDGFGDIARISTNSSSRIVLYTHSGNTLVPTVWNNNAYVENTDVWQAGDFNGDGKLDLLRISKDGGNVQFELFSNTGSSFSIDSNWTQDETHNFTPFDRWLTADFNADGRVDLACVYGNGSSGLDGDTKVQVYLNRESAADATRFTRHDWGSTGTDFQISTQFFPGDFTGDGLPDIVMRYDSNGTSSGGDSACGIFKNTGTTFSYATWTLASSTPFADYSWATGDFNGDSLLDLIRVKSNSGSNTTSLVVYPSTGKQFSDGEGWSPSLYTTGGVNLYVGDYNGDGRSDVSLIISKAYEDARDEAHPTDHDWNNEFQRSEYRSIGQAASGTGFYLKGVTNDNHSNEYYPIKSKQYFAADFNGDGKEDLCRLATHTESTGMTTAFFTLWQDSPSAESPGYLPVRDNLTKFTNGYGAETSMNYKPLTDPTVYTKATVALAGTINLFPAIPVIASISSDNGMGGTRTVTYSYTGLRASPTRGLLGFETVSTLDDAAGVRSVTWLKQEFPYIGAAWKSETSVRPSTAWVLNSRTTNIWSHITTANASIYFPAPLSSVVENYDLDGTLISKVTTSNAKAANAGELAYDVWGNSLEIKTTSYDPVANQTFWKRTTNSYAAYFDDTTWQIGQLTASSIESDGTDQGNQYRNSSFSYGDDSAGLLNGETIEAGDTGNDIPQTTSYQFDAFGNTTVSQVTAWSGRLYDDGSEIPGADGKPAKETRTTKTEFDSTGRFPVKLTNAINQVETRTYDLRLGLLSTTTGPNGLVNRTYYDDFGRLYPRNPRRQHRNFDPLLPCRLGLAAAPKCALRR